MLGILAAMAFIPDPRVPLATGLASLAIAVALFWLSRALSAGRLARAPAPAGPNAAEQTLRSRVDKDS
jgi:hypothetical protein